MKKILTFPFVKSNLYVQSFLLETDKKLRAMKFTDHGIRHADMVSTRSEMIAKNIGLSRKEVEYCKIAGYCHDFGNFIDRKLHHYWGSLLFHQVFSQISDDVSGITSIMQAIANHDKDETRLTNKISAVLIIADKSDVHRDRVISKELSNPITDIHDRVNFAVYENNLSVDPEKKDIILSMKLDTVISPISEYFEIFSERMNYCRISAKYLKFSFQVIINDVVLT